MTSTTREELEQVENRKECSKWIEENKRNLNEEWLSKFEAKYYQNVKVKKSALQQWLLKPERLKETKKRNEEKKGEK